MFFFIYIECYFLGKYHRGKRVEGHWVFGGVERGKSKCFLLPVEDKKATTLISLICKWILPGTTIISDCWASYSTIRLIFP